MKTRLATSSPMLEVLRVYLRVTAWVSLAIGFAFLFTAVANEPLLQERDVVIGVSSQVLLLIGSILSLGLGCFLFSNRDLKTQGFAILWVALTFLFYRIGMVWMRAAAPFPVVILTGWKLGIQPATLDVCWKGFMTFFVAGGGGLLLQDCLQRKRLKSRAIEISQLRLQK